MKFDMTYSMKNRFIRQKTAQYYESQKIAANNDDTNQENQEAEKKKKEEKYKANFNFIIYINKFFEFFLEGYYQHNIYNYKQDKKNNLPAVVINLSELLKIVDKLKFSNNYDLFLKCARLKMFYAKILAENRKYESAIEEYDYALSFIQHALVNIQKIVPNL